MINISTPKDKQAILDYIGERYDECIYLYLNFCKYQYGTDRVTPYIMISNEDDSLNGVLLKYYDCLHIFSKSNNLYVDELTYFIKQHNPSVIYVNKTFNDKMDVYLKKNYNPHNMSVIEKLYKPEYTINDINLATPSDISEIASLLAADKIFKPSYKSAKELEEQLLSRMEDGFGCTYYKKENNKIIWTSSVVAQNEKIAIQSLSWLSPEYRGKGLGKAAVSTVTNLLIEQKKRVFGLPVESTVGLNNAIGCINSAEIVKWIQI